MMSSARNIVHRWAGRTTGRLVAAALAALVGGAADAAGVLNIAHWGDAIDPRVIEDFTRETGVRVTYDAYDSNETLEARLRVGGAAYDLVAPNAAVLQRHISAGLYQPLDKARLSNWKELDPALLQHMNGVDPGAQFSAPYLWSTAGFAYNIDKVRARLGDASLDSWDMVFKSQNLAKLADCGVYVLDSPQDILTIAAKYLDLDPALSTAQEIRRAADVVIGVRRFIRKFHAADHVNALASGDICLAVGWGADALQARDRAREAAAGVNIGYVAPREGTVMTIDALAIPKDARNVAEAHLFLDFLLRPDIAARNTIMTGFLNATPGSSKFLPRAMMDEGVVPSAAMIRKSVVVNARDQNWNDLITREWARVKLGR